MQGRAVDNVQVKRTRTVEASEYVQIINLAYEAYVRSGYTTGGWAGLADSKEEYAEYVKKLNSAKVTWQRKNNTAGVTVSIGHDANTDNPLGLAVAFKRNEHN